MAPPAAANKPKPPMGAWFGAPGKVGWAEMIEIRGSVMAIIILMCFCILFPYESILS